MKIQTNLQQMEKIILLWFKNIQKKNKKVTKKDKPREIISGGRKDLNRNDLSPIHSIKIGGGIGMK